MESSLPTSRLISAIRNNFPADSRLLYPRLKGIKTRHNNSASAKRLVSQDFREYAKPIQLLPVSKPETCSSTDTFVKNVAELIRSECYLYKVRLTTSKLYGSDLSDLNAGILLCVMDGNGNAILQRFSATCSSFVSDDKLHFRRGSVDDFVFNGSKLGNVEAVWLSIESGQWRLAGLNVTIVTSGEEAKEQCYYTCLEYGFDLDEDLLLGEGRHSSSMVELRPTSVLEFTSNDFTRFNVELESVSLGISNEESMKEYSYLKSTLLLYDTLLILLGSTVSFISIGEDVGLAFLTGGIGGFLYLLFLQRSVDMLGKNEDDKPLEGLKVNLSGLVLLLSVAFVVAKYGWSTNTAMLTAKEVIFGMSGFLACKVAVVLAAFRPTSNQYTKEKNK